MGRKHSKKRDAVLKAIQSTYSHPGAQWIYDTLKPSIPSLSLGTVYRNINVFLEEGAVVSVGTVGGEERFDGRVSPHPHLICCRCGKVSDLPCPPEGDGAQAAEAGSLPGGFVIDYRKTVYYGLCGECAAEAQVPPETAGPRSVL
ncbi:MAG: transcriptional repressor [Treponema sp.]|jgi:Fur family peroxide stress response transcriptional regulator|nr:transcriptional repressor [Treponema sp.]